MSGARRVLSFATAWTSRATGAALLLVLRTWQVLASPTYGQTCRFYPSCSAYAVGAVRAHGPARGSWLMVRRLVRCHPWNPGGFDPVPPASPTVSRRDQDDHKHSRTADLAGHHQCALRVGRAPEQAGT
jgi:hypothetical protein